MFNNNFSKIMGLLVIFGFHGVVQPLGRLGKVGLGLGTAYAGTVGLRAAIYIKVKNAFLAEKNEEEKSVYKKCGIPVARLIEFASAAPAEEVGRSGKEFATKALEHIHTWKELDAVRGITQCVNRCALQKALKQGKQE